MEKEWASSTTMVILHTLDIPSITNYKDNEKPSLFFSAQYFVFLVRITKCTNMEYSKGPYRQHVYPIIKCTNFEYSKDPYRQHVYPIFTTLYM